VNRYFDSKISCSWKRMDGKGRERRRNQSEDGALYTCRRRAWGVPHTMIVVGSNSNADGRLYRDQRTNQNGLIAERVDKKCGVDDGTSQ
jgi:hypothetical protein